MSWFDPPPVKKPLSPRMPLVPKGMKPVRLVGLLIAGTVFVAILGAALGFVILWGLARFFDLSPNTRGLVLLTCALAGAYRGYVRTWKAILIATAVRQTTHA